MMHDNEKENKNIPFIELKTLTSPKILEKLASTTETNSMDLSDILRSAANESKEDNEEISEAFGLLSAIADMRIKVVKNQAKLRPWLDVPNQQSLASEHFSNAQVEIFAKAAPQIEHLGMQARLADIAWSKNHSLVLMLTHARDSYCKFIHKRLAGILTNSVCDRVGPPSDLLEVLLRAIALSRYIAKKNPLPPQVLDAFVSIFEHVKKNKYHSLLIQISDIAETYKLADNADMATYISASADAASEDGLSVHLVENLWLCAADLYKKSGDRKKQLNCISEWLESVKKQLDAANTASDKLHHIRRAISFLRSIGSFSDEIKVLRADMLKLQDPALDELRPIQHEIDISAAVTVTEDKFSNTSLHESFLAFACLSRPLEKNDLIAQAEKMSGVSSQVFGTINLDNSGKIQHRIPPSGRQDSSQMPEPATTYIMLHRWSEIAAGRIEPARREMARRFDIDLYTFRYLTCNSPLIPPKHERVFARGFLAIMEGEYEVAASILIPQFENAMRQVLYNHGIDSSVLEADMIQEETSMAAMYKNHRKALEQIFGADIVHELYMLFLYRGGGLLRHTCCHGKLNSDEFYGTNVIYACWFIFQLVCAPLFEKWPQINFS
jgi:hypothetical protein